MRRLLLLSLALVTSVLAWSAPAGASHIYSTKAEKALEALITPQSNCCAITKIYTASGAVSWTWPTADGVAGAALVTNGAGVLSFTGVVPPGGAIGGSGTIGTIPKFTAAQTLGNSLLTESGAVMTVAGTLNATNFNGIIGATTPAAGSFTTVSASGQITSTLATGTAPFVVASTTNVPNLNASLLLGATWASPAAIGTGTPAAGTFTTVTATTRLLVANGSASSPSLSWSSDTDTNTGLYLVSQNNFGFTTNGSLRATWADNHLRFASDHTIGFTPTTDANAANDTVLTRSAAGIFGVTSAFEFTEIAAPSAPAANKVRLYSQDNGSGKTQLCALFASGVTQCFATEP